MNTRTTKEQLEYTLCGVCQAKLRQPDEIREVEKKVFCPFGVMMDVLVHTEKEARKQKMRVGVCKNCYVVAKLLTKPAYFLLYTYGVIMCWGRRVLARL